MKVMHSKFKWNFKFKFKFKFKEFESVKINEWMNKSLSVQSRPLSLSSSAPESPFPQMGTTNSSRNNVTHDIGFVGVSEVTAFGEFVVCDLRN